MEQKHTFGTFEATLGLEFTLLKLGKLDEALLYHTKVSERLSRLSAKELTDDRWKTLVAYFDCNLEEIAKAYLELGDQHGFGYTAEDYYLAEQNYREAINYAPNNSHHAIKAKIGLEYALANEKKWDEALILNSEVEQACLVFCRQNVLKDHGYCLIEIHKSSGALLGRQHIERGDKYKNEAHNYNLAEQNYRKAVELYGKGNSYNAFTAKRRLGCMLIILEKQNEAMLDEAFAIYKKIGAYLQDSSQEERNQQPLWSTFEKHFIGDMADIA